MCVCVCVIWVVSSCMTPSPRLYPHLRPPPNPVRIVHFNDVYEIQPRASEPVGGAAKFAGFVRSLDAADRERPLILFSGDAANPSLLSTLTKGAHMPPVLNAIGVDCAVYGNHGMCG